MGDGAPERSADGQRRRRVPEISVLRAPSCKGESFTSYSVDVRLLGARWTVVRRYSEFDALRATLQRKYVPDVIPRKHWPSFPEKRILNRFQANVISDRAEGLEAFMNSIMSAYADPVAHDSDLLKFLEAPERCSTEHDIQSAQRRFSARIVAAAVAAYAGGCDESAVQSAIREGQERAAWGWKHGLENLVSGRDLPSARPGYMRSLSPRSPSTRRIIRVHPSLQEAHELERRWADFIIRQARADKRAALRLQATARGRRVRQQLRQQQIACTRVQQAFRQRRLSRQALLSVQARGARVMTHEYASLAGGSEVEGPVSWQLQGVGAISTALSAAVPMFRCCSCRFSMCGGRQWRLQLHVDRAADAIGVFLVYEGGRTDGEGVEPRGLDEHDEPLAFTLQLRAHGAGGQTAVIAENHTTKRRFTAPGDGWGHLRLATLHQVKAAAVWSSIHAWLLHLRPSRVALPPAQSSPASAGSPSWSAEQQPCYSTPVRCYRGPAATTEAVGSAVTPSVATTPATLGTEAAALPALPQATAIPKTADRGEAEGEPGAGEIDDAGAVEAAASVAGAREKQSDDGLARVSAVSVSASTDDAIADHHWGDMDLPVSGSLAAEAAALFSEDDDDDDNDDDEEQQQEQQHADLRENQEQEAPAGEDKKKGTETKQGVQLTTEEDEEEEKQEEEPRRRRRPSEAVAFAAMDEAAALRRRTFAALAQFEEGEGSEDE
jgi:hypothetical protein